MAVHVADQILDAAQGRPAASLVPQQQIASAIHTAPGAALR